MNKSVIIGCLLAMFYSANVFADDNWWGYLERGATTVWDYGKKLIPLSDKAEITTMQQVWSQINPQIEKILLAEQQDKPTSRLDQLLDEAVAILSLSGSSEIRTQILALEREIAALRLKIAEHRQAQIAAPLQSTRQTTAAQHEQQIAYLQTQLEHKLQQVKQLKLEFTHSLREIGLELTNEQLELLFSSVIGDDILQTNIVYENVKLINQNLMQLSIDSGEDLILTKRYYAMHIVLLQIIAHMQVSFVDKVNQNYLPKLAEIVQRTQTLRAQTKNLLQRQPEQQPQLTANLQAQQLTLKTADVYRNHLINQRQKMLAARNKTAQDLELARNTYATVTLSGELVQLLRRSQNEFSILQNMQLPELLLFENLNMKQEFAILTQQMAHEVL